MQWNSPWGKGYPGWHIECSVMATKYIGETLDIHCGGIENSFPHHECEIAQSEAATNKPFSRFFVHHNMLTVNGTKMGKSLGNFIILKDLFKKIDPMVLRFYILLGHYRSPLDFTEDALNSAKAGFDRMKNSIFTLKKFLENIDADSGDSFADIDELKSQFIAAMDDDINTPIAISVIYEILKISNTEMLSQKPNLKKLKSVEKTIDDFVDNILGIKIENDCGAESIDDKLIEFILEMRKTYRDEKNFKMSDEIRDKLKALGVTIKDGAEGTSYTK